MKTKKAAKSQVKFDTQKAFAGMGAAVEILMKAAPNAFSHKVECKEVQGKLRSQRIAA
ncbi:hypothetical protein [Hafnia paralvei]|uniref:hypothetical protein n=1 Tax=Hafnia paralvei TaxID=546367 RepID=UPI00187D3134|nr:hypothetical protein [Hafnia paralvei]